MAKKQAMLSGPVQALRAVAMRYPEAEEGIACEGTAAERQTVKVRNKAFMFLGAADAMLKLGASLADANELAAKEPGQLKVGIHGWVTLTLKDGTSPPVDVLARWVDESYRLVAPKPLVALLPEAGPPTARPASKAASKPASKAASKPASKAASKPASKKAASAAPAARRTR